MVVTLAAAKQVAVILVIEANPKKKKKSQEVCNHKKCTKQFTKKQIIGNNISKNHLGNS